jgi:hypothetical protein
MRAIKAATQAEADALRSKVDAAYGYPRCDRLSGTIAPAAGRRALTCPCRTATAPDSACTFSTRAETLPVELTDRSWAYPVREDESVTMAALTKSERGRVVDVADSERRAAAASAERT